MAKSKLLKDPVYRAWAGMKDRCYNPSYPKWHRYGGRGITVCEEWRNDFNAFKEYMGERPDGTSLDRIDNNGNYEPGNVRWATGKQQTRNSTTSVRVEAFGEVKTIVEWAEDTRCVVNYRNLRARIREKGWSPEKAITTPVQRRAA